ncbi:triosephosphate isomerase [Caproiciproducens sp. NJN-50]|uniref:triose-phosphate isomerase family protein n=1 Tax=Acutalibacteraceae TaxID=3082771 RepID=UPI000FFE2E2D|nr:MULTISPECIES: triose-phosphate isomerase family protein [Acutalibacteraceae]QAT50959.1 triosephosphate isomerase [Caproiciproducens sp. NJN-50]
MKNIFINLKRFDVPREKGGVCPSEQPGEWIEEVMKDSVNLGIGLFPDVNVVYFVPEALILPAQKAIGGFPAEQRGRLSVGCQSVFRDNIKKGKNFGAFTSNMPAASAWQMGCRWSIVGHSEERRDKQEIIGAFQPDWNQDAPLRERCAAAVDGLINREVLSALEQGMNVLLCMGETAEERGEGSMEQQQNRVKAVLSAQLARGLKGVTEYLPERKIAIGYEPIWAIGPGKTPPGKEYISYVSSMIKEIVGERFGFEIPVVYGGGLKEENAEMIGGIDSVDGGLVALTRFSGEIGFFTEDLKKIVEKYLAGNKEGENV